MNNNLTKDNFLYLPNFITPEQARELAEEFKNFANETGRKQDIQAPLSQSAYDYIGFLELLCEKTPEVSSFLGSKVLPTYTYARIYKNGSVLERHTDRAACEISITLHLSGDTTWPIFIKKPNGDEVSLNLKSGDAIMYLGCDAEHWREQFTGQEYIQVFLHYVESRGKNSFAYFDKTKVPEQTTLNDSTGIFNSTKAPAIVHKNEYKKNLEDYIITLDNMMPDELCDLILNEYGNSIDWFPTTVGPEGSLNRNIRNADTVCISLDNIIARNQELRKAIDSDVFVVANNSIRKYNEIFPEAKIEQDSGYELLRYNEGQFYIQHTDSFKMRPRAVSCSIALNDDYEGGEFAFFGREIKIKLKKGSVLLFPSNFMYPHEIMPVTKGTRYSIITWFI